MKRKQYILLLSILVILSPSCEKNQNPDSFKGYSFPICQTFEIDNPNDRNLANATINGNVCTFNGGMEIKWLRTKENKSKDTLVWQCPGHTQPSSGTDADKSIHRNLKFNGFAQYDTILISAPVKEALSGDLRLMLGSRGASFTSENYWEYYWSNDGNNWNKIPEKAAISPGSDAFWSVLYFTIPGDKRIPEKGTLYFKFIATTERTKEFLAIANSICICNAKAQSSNLPEMDDTKIVFSHGFDDLIESPAAYAELPLGFMCSSTTGYASNYTSFNKQYEPTGKYNDILVTRGCYERPGYLQLGFYDESLWTRQCCGSYEINIGKRLKDMDISSASVKVSFTAAKFKDCRGYDAVSNVYLKCNDDSINVNVAIGKFSSYEATFAEVNQDSKCLISSHKLSDSEIDDLNRGTNAKNLIDNRFYIDDVLVEIIPN